jgi:hypothetical protein
MDKNDDVEDDNNNEDNKNGHQDGHGRVGDLRIKGEVRGSNVMDFLPLASVGLCIARQRVPPFWRAPGNQ